MMEIMMTLSYKAAFEAEPQKHNLVLLKPRCSTSYLRLHRTAQTFTSVERPGSDVSAPTARPE